LLEKYRALLAATRRSLPPPRGAHAPHGQSASASTKQNLVERWVGIEELRPARDIAKIWY